MHIFVKGAHCFDGLNSNEQNTRVQDYIGYGSFRVSHRMCPVECLNQTKVSSLKTNHLKIKKKHIFGVKFINSSLGNHFLKMSMVSQTYTLL
jgi:hypothetical protein